MKNTLMYIKPIAVTVLITCQAPPINLYFTAIHALRIFLKSKTIGVSINLKIAGSSHGQYPTPWRHGVR
jgi:hypothetical protein